jgi:hypothetical protein
MAGCGTNAPARFAIACYPPNFGCCRLNRKHHDHSGQICREVPLVHSHRVVQHARLLGVPPAQAYNNFIHFWKNVSIMGGMLLLLVTGPGRYALDAKVAWRS